MSYERAEIPILESVAGLSTARKAWFCDVWGVLHNGLEAFGSAVEACRAFRRHGGRVILISNSPRPGDGVIKQLAALDIHEDCFDGIVTSGDVTRSLVKAHGDRPLYHLGPERDRAFFEGLDVRLVPAEEAQILVCTGLVDDENETLADHEDMLQRFASRGVPMICANPDLIVERGSKLVLCAGSLAKRYEELGQTVMQAGKPYAPIYDLAFESFGRGIAPSEILAIGDGIDTDIRGAAAWGVDAVYIASRVHLGQREPSASLSGKVLGDLFRDRPFRPLAALPQLAW